jgi:UDP-N-acetyl-2-amino-2-deoxyglucuronate dehydrogenase
MISSALSMLLLLLHNDQNNTQHKYRIERMNSITNRKIRLGRVGCGRISGKHFDALEQHLERVDVVALCDHDRARAQEAAGRFEAKVYDDLDAMLSAEDLDIVTVTTPNGLHAEHVKKIADYGVHVLTEKPMAIDTAVGKDMIAYCAEKNVRLFVVYQNRFNDTVQAVRHALEQGRFGQIYMITSNVFWTRPQDYYDKEGAWHGTKDMDGGAFFTQASHYVDLMQWLAGARPKNVSAIVRTLARDIETEDSGIAHIEWENGVLGAINMTMLTYPKNLEGSVTILGEKGTVRIGGVAMNSIEHWDFAEDMAHDESIRNANYDTASVYGHGHVRYYENMFDALQGKCDPLVDGAEGYKSVDLIERILKSSAA